jgi:nucleoside-diphosphate-sugar epimerase
MMDSRVDSARIVGRAIAAATRPPRVWLQMSTATIYAHRFDAAHDEATGVIGGSETGVPDYWAYSVEIARNWERAQAEAPTPATRKVALRSAMVMSPDRGGVFDVLLRMTRLGLGGPVAGGAQYVSWIHDEDFVRAVEFLIARRPRRTGEPRLARPSPPPAVHADPALGRGRSVRTARDTVDDQAGGVRDALGHGTAAQEPAGGSGPSPRGRVRLRPSRLGRGRLRPRTPLPSGRPLAAPHPTPFSLGQHHVLFKQHHDASTMIEYSACPRFIGAMEFS